MHFKTTFMRILLIFTNRTFYLFTSHHSTQLGKALLFRQIAIRVIFEASVSLVEFTLGAKEMRSRSIKIILTYVPA